MRKLHYFLTLFCILLLTEVNAQDAVTALVGPQVTTPSNIAVVVSRSSPLPNSSGAYCVSPYQIGKNYSDWYQYFFPNKITNATLKLIRIHREDTVLIEVLPSAGAWQGLDLTTGNVTAFGAACVPPHNSAGITGTNAGILYTTAVTSATPGEGAEIDIQLTPNTISGIRVTHLHGTAASDVVYSLEVQDDTCKLGFVATVDTPGCSGRDLHFDATQFPNTTYSWAATTTSGQTPPWSPNPPNVRNPTVVKATQAHSGKYVVTATRGTCIYKDSVEFLVNQSPSTGQPIQVGPVCPNEDDTIKVPLVNLPTGGWVVAYGSVVAPAPFQDTFDANNNYILVKKAVTKANEGIYHIYAVDISGCVSDTNDFPFYVNDDVTAAFTATVIEDCDIDTVVFTNNSIANNTQIWSFGDGTTSTEKDPTHAYPVPKPNHADSRDFGIRLIVSNSLCWDTLTQNISIKHPVKAGYKVDKDSICQGSTVMFIEAEDSSKVKPGTIPRIHWYFGDGTVDSTTNKFDQSYTYDVAGIYHTKLIMRDYLWCEDSFKIDIVVDSAGFITFVTDKQSVCVGDEIVFTGDYSEYGYVSATWDLGDGVTIPDSINVKHSYNEPGTYDVKFDIDYRICDDASFSGQLEVKPIPNIYLGEDTAICLDGERILIQDIYNLGNNNDIKYSWNTPTKDVTPGIYVTHHGIYSVVAEKDGCTATDSVVVKKNCYINIPNAFTPNGDGNSDYFLPRQIVSRNVTSFKMVVYNRWGEKVFESDVTNGRGWDGKYGGVEQPTGVYIYAIDVTFGNGYTERYQGNVTLVR